MNGPPKTDIPQIPFIVEEKRMNVTIAPHDLHRLLHAEHDDPFSVLGPHNAGTQRVVRAFRPEAKALAVVDRHDRSRRFEAQRVAEEGFFEAALGEGVPRFDYLLELTPWNGEVCQTVRLLTLIFGAAAFENSGLLWACERRSHHKHVDDDDQDPYCISKGLFYAHIGWLLFELDPPPAFDNVADLAG
jgi:hypothetical protein